MFVVCVEFGIADGAMDAFLPLMMEQAKNSLALEPECHHFDVCRDPDGAAKVFLYELYTDKAAFMVHLQSEHFKSFDAAAAPMVASKQVQTWHKLEASA